MTDRRGIILLFFDLPMVTKKDRKEYYFFRKKLKQSGYVNIQESVLIKLIHNSSFAKKEIAELHKISPKNGAVYAVPIGISNFMKLSSISGIKFDFDFFTGNTIYL